MARNVSITALEPGSGKSAVVLGLIEGLFPRAGGLAFFRPLIAAGDVPDPDIELIRDRYRLQRDYAESYVLTTQDLHQVSDRGQYDELLKRILTGYRALAENADVVVVEGSDFTAASPVSRVVRRERVGVVCGERVGG